MVIRGLGWKRAIIAGELALVLGFTACASQGTRVPPEPALGSGSEGARVALATGPRAHLPNPVIDLGTHLDTRVVSTTVAIQNVGDEVLELHYVPRYSAADPGTVIVQPGETYEDTARLDLHRRPPGDVEFPLRWRTNDPENPFITITLRAHVRGIVETTVTPR
ncbi:MAG: hypothetical protein ACFCBV_06035 [Phycisphaerales bacterium]